MQVYLEVWSKGEQPSYLIKYDNNGFIPAIGDRILGFYKKGYTNDEVFVFGDVFQRTIGQGSITIRINQF
jgi:hypothetical protein